MQVADWLVIFAILLAPIIAVQAQWRVELRREKRGQKDRIFQALMATRAARVAPTHVQALNMITLVFTKKREQAVLEAWKVYHDHLHQGAQEAQDDPAVTGVWVAVR